eukprot:12988958-Ditylum_brightwellii.AAC.1
MAMYLANVPVFTIMLIGRWSSDAFLVYIRKQVQDFTKGISSRMLLSPDYFTIPDIASNPEDPRARFAPQAFATRTQSQNGGNLDRQLVAPRFALHH